MLCHAATHANQIPADVAAPTRPPRAATGTVEQRRLCDELLRTLLDAPDVDLGACEHLGMAPLGHLLAGALERQLIAARDMIDYSEPIWQVGGGWADSGRLVR